MSDSSTATAKRRKCDRCGNLDGHEPIEDAVCAFRQATTAEVRRLAVELGADPQSASQLLSYLRTMHSDADAYRAARVVIQLGWRKTVGSL